MGSDYDPLTNPMTKEQWIAWKLLQLQKQGIDPFIELDVGNAPSNGDALADVIRHRKIYGDVINGFYIDGIEVDDSLNIQYPDLERVTLRSTVSGVTSAVNKVTQLNWLAAPAGYAPTSATPTTVTSYQIDTAALTLSSGSIAATAIVAPGASKKAYCHYCIIDSDNTSTPESTYYQLNFTEETSGDYLASLTIQQTAGMGGQKIPLEFVTSTNDKDVNCAVSGGQGAETIHIRIAWGKV